MEHPLDALLRRHYGIEPVRLEPCERGYVARPGSPLGAAFRRADTQPMPWNELLP